MPLFVAHDPDGLPSTDGAELDRIRRFCGRGDDADMYSVSNTVLCVPPDRYADVSVECVPQDERLSAVYGDAYLGGDRLDASQLDRVIPDRVESVNGEFVCIHRDGSPLQFATDRLNLRHLYCYESADLFVAGSHVQPVLEYLCAVDRARELSINRTAIAEFLDFGHLLGLKTRFDGIDLLPGATVRTLRGGGLEHVDSQYWEFDYGEYFQDASTAAKALSDAFERAVALRTRESRRYGLHLSGGLDSRLILAATPSKVDLTTYSFGVRGSDEPKIARLASWMADRESQIFPLQSYVPEYAEEGVIRTDGMVPVTNFHHLPSMAELSDRCDVLLLGTSLDVLIEGSKLTPAMHDGNFGATDLYRKTPDVSDELWEAVFGGRTYVDRALSRQSLVDSYERESFQHVCNKFDVWNMKHRQSRYIFRGGSHSIDTFLPVSNPLGDANLLETMLRIPPSMRLSTDLRREMLRRIKWRLSLVPNANTWAPPLLPQLKYVFGPFHMLLGNRATRRKLPLVSDELRLGYPDYASWLRTDREYNEFTRRKLRAFAERGYCDPQPLLDALDRHERGEANYTDELTNVTTLEIWHEQILDRYPQIEPEMSSDRSEAYVE